ncbi:histidine phosphatase family protein [Acidisoma cellulosilytica]|uniref:Histidine phosphatase family protein n=1 Tax=Acidisoma cellulosilyticum TaxID=2802395 RepID=A0A963YYR7_9PROT|nr:histidine phosphatase family protein [Acidisoma cellulosilyticum]MCB8879733.1 histidine phosphatase family protein [Acidisoma cellulosilyticum]
MSPSRIIIIRHAEKPTKPGDEPAIAGIAENGSCDKKSLTPRGWQRAGALVRFFCPLHPPPGFGLLPSIIYAAGAKTKDDSKRPTQTVQPLADLMQSQHVPFIESFGKDDLQAAMTEALTRNGIVLMAWEHHRIPDLAALLHPVPATPDAWPDDRFDVLWVFDHSADGWAFSQIAQRLLNGDDDTVI